MISSFYQRYSRFCIGAFLLSLTVIHPLAESIPPNNNTETWLSDDDGAQALYQEFRHHFGAEEVILLTLDRELHDAEFLEALSGRLEGLEEIRVVWSPGRFEKLMRRFGVRDEQIPGRLEQVAVSKDGKLAGLVALLTPAGVADRATTMSQVTGVLEYCQLTPQDVRIAGAPVVIAELDRLGGKQANQSYFIVTLLICLGVLWLTLRDFLPALLILASTVWAFQATLAVVYLCGGEMNFILDSLPVLVMTFATAVAIHYLYHYAGCLDDPRPVQVALKSVSWPCILAMATTAIGLASLCSSSIPPVRQFGLATAGGTLAALIAGLGITPAILTVWPPVRYRHRCWAGWFEHLAGWLELRCRPVAAVVSLVVVTCAIGLCWLEAEFKPLNFFPETSRVLQDTHALRDQMAGTDSVEVVVDFGGLDLTETDRVEIVREIEQSLLNGTSVPVVLSAANWLPDPMPQGFSPELVAMREHSAGSDFVSDSGHIWRLSARICAGESETQQQILTRIERRASEAAHRHGIGVYCTGIAPLVERAQENIFWGFWKSVLMACCLITLIMMCCLGSVRAGIIAMFPNVTPIAVVFGLLGWFGVPTDIGTMMTGSIALGIAVDGTFHFLTRYRRCFAVSGDTASATRQALVEAGPPIVQATLVTSLGMLALTVSNFVPTSRFGLLMAASLGVALVGDLILLPCLLFLRPARKQPDDDQTGGAADEDTLCEQTMIEPISEFAPQVSVPHFETLSARATPEPRRRHHATR